MRYVIVSIVRGEAGDFNNTLRKDVFEKFNIKSSKLPAHFTIKSPFESDNINDLDSMLKNFIKSHHSTPYKLCGYDSFDNRVIYMKAFMSGEAKSVHDELIDILSNINYINFDSLDGKDKVFHVTVSSKKIQKIFNNIFDYVTKFPVYFNCSFDNISVYKWENNTWILYNTYNF